MEGDVQFPVIRTPDQLPGCNQEGENEHRLLPGELRLSSPGDSLPQPPLAPDLADRVHRDDGDLAVPLLPPRRASGGFPPHD